MTLFRGWRRIFTRVLRGRGVLLRLKEHVVGEMRVFKANKNEMIMGKNEYRTVGKSKC